MTAQRDLTHTPPTLAEDKAPLGEVGIHDRYHLSPFEKRLLACELRDYAASRFGGEPCPSCLFDALIYATYEHAKDTLNNPDLNSGTASDFIERGADYGDILHKVGRRAEVVAIIAAKREGLL